MLKKYLKLLSAATRSIITATPQTTIVTNTLSPMECMGRRLAKRWQTNPL